MLPDLSRLHVQRSGVCGGQLTLLSPREWNGWFGSNADFRTCVSSWSQTRAIKFRKTFMCSRRVGKPKPC